MPDFQKGKISRENKKYDSDGTYQTIVSQTLFNLDATNPRLLAPGYYQARLQRLTRALKAERLKGLEKHWSYDLNRHIALKKERERLLKDKENLHIWKKSPPS